MGTRRRVWICVESPCVYPWNAWSCKIALKPERNELILTCSEIKWMKTLSRLMEWWIKIGSGDGVEKRKNYWDKKNLKLYLHMLAQGLKQCVYLLVNWNKQSSFSQICYYGTGFERSGPYAWLLSLAKQVHCGVWDLVLSLSSLVKVFFKVLESIWFQLASWTVFHVTSGQHFQCDHLFR